MGEWEAIKLSSGETAYQRPGAYGGTIQVCQRSNGSPPGSIGGMTTQGCTTWCRLLGFDGYPYRGWFRIDGCDQYKPWRDLFPNGFLASGDVRAAYWRGAFQVVTADCKPPVGIDWEDP